MPITFYKQPRALWLVPRQTRFLGTFKTQANFTKFQKNKKTLIFHEKSIRKSANLKEQRAGCLGWSFKSIFSAAQSQAF